MCLVVDFTRWQKLKYYLRLHPKTKEDIEVYVFRIVEDEKIYSPFAFLLLSWGLFVKIFEILSLCLCFSSSVESLYLANNFKIYATFISSLCISSSSKSTSSRIDTFSLP